MKQELQNTAVTDNAHVLSEGTDVKVQNIYNWKEHHM